MLPTLTLCLAGLSPAAPPVPPAPVREAGVAATVRVVDPDGGGVGTGVVLEVRDGSVYVLTAAHILGADARPRVETFRPADPTKPDSAHDRCELLFRAGDADLAVLRLPAGKRAWAAVRLAQPPGTGRGPDAGWSVGCNGGGGPQVEAVVISGRKLVRRKDGMGAFFWQANGEAASGRSGGPLLDADGRLIGICSGTQDKMTYYSHPDEIRAALRAHRLGWLAADKTEK